RASRGSRGERFPESAPWSWRDIGQDQPLTGFSLTPLRVFYSVSVVVRGGLKQQPVHKFPSRGEVLLVGPGLAMVCVFVVKPGIDDGNDSSLSVFCGGDDGALSVAKERSGGRLHGDSAGVLHIERVRMVKDGAGPAGGD